MRPFFNIVAATSENTVASAYEPSGVRAEQYQSEAELEAEFIRMLQGQGYEYLRLGTEAEMTANLRRQLEMLNNCRFTDREWERFFTE